MMHDGNLSGKRLTFSQRNRLKPIPQPMSLRELSHSLRLQVWDEIHQTLAAASVRKTRFSDDGQRFVERVLGTYLEKPVDEIPGNSFGDFDRVCTMFKAILLDGPYNEALDLLEITVRDLSASNRLVQAISRAFDDHAAAYWLDLSNVPCEFLPRSSEAEGCAARRAIEQLQSDGMEGAATHFRNAGKHINSGAFADAIRESIHGVESVARQIDPKASNTLGPALVSLQKAGKLQHPALKTAFNRLYDYTNDEDGIRHALLESDAPNVGLEEAMFMFGACASFANYLFQKHQRSS